MKAYLEPRGVDIFDVYVLMYGRPKIYLPHNKIFLWGGSRRVGEERVGRGGGSVGSIKYPLPR